MRSSSVLKTPSGAKEKAVTPPDVEDTLDSPKDLVESAINSILDRFTASEDEDTGVDSEWKAVNEEDEERDNNEESKPTNTPVTHESQYQVPAGNRIRSTNVPSNFTFVEHKRTIAATMGITDGSMIKDLEIAWKLSTAKKSDLPVEFGSEKDLKTMIVAYRLAVEKEEKKHLSYLAKVKKGAVKPGTKEPAQVDIVVVISDIGVKDKKKDKAREADTVEGESAVAGSTKADTTFYQRLRAAHSCATDPRAVCFLTPTGEHIHATPNDINTWELLEKRHPEKYSIESGQIPPELKLYDALGRRPGCNAGASGSTQAAQVQAPNLNTTFQLPNTSGGFGTYPSIQPGVLGAFDPSLLFASAAFDPFARLALGYGNTGGLTSPFDAPASPYKAEISVDYPLITEWLSDAVDGNSKRVRDGQSYLIFGEQLVQAGFFRIDELVNKKHVNVDLLKSIGIEVGYASNILSWAEADVTKIQHEAKKAKRLAQF
ncbi:hypothetical protein FRB90_001745 [Tulasnella sp. 427]|nr:hypothetical protein FRB90_001745 [Tulasnella sp. 427]